MWFGGAGLLPPPGDRLSSFPNFQAHGSVPVKPVEVGSVCSGLQWRPLEPHGKRALRSPSPSPAPMWPARSGGGREYIVKRPGNGGAFYLRVVCLIKSAQVYLVPVYVLILCQGWESMLNIKRCC